MAETYFGKHCVWMNLLNYDELFCLMSKMRENSFDGKIQQIKRTYDNKLGKRITVVIERPGIDRYIRGEEYRKWEKCKTAVYVYHRLRRV